MILWEYRRSVGAGALESRIRYSFFVHKRIISAVRREELVSDRIEGAAI
jgi:hypothetical protein